MKKLRAVILAVSLGTLGSIAALGQTGNTAYGTGALTSNTTGSYNTALGYLPLAQNNTGTANTAVGTDALVSNTTGSDNTATGYNALYSNTGSANTAFGQQALLLNTTGGGNVACGASALYGNTTGSDNIGIGYYAGQNITTGSGNIDIGNLGSSIDSGVTRIGTANQQTSFYAAGISGVGIRDGVEVFINSSGQLGTVNSSIRFKQDVHDMAGVSDKLFQLRPVTYRYKQAYADGSKSVEYGLIAEEVAKVYPDLVVKGADGKIQTVQYQKLTPMLLNEVQKEHRQLEAQQQTIELLQQRLSGLEAALNLENSKFQLAAK
jgi:hypothetical protein